MASTSSSPASSYPGQDSNSDYSASSPSSSTTNLSSASLNLISPPPPRSSSSPSPYASLSFQYNPLNISRITTPERINERRSRYAELDPPPSTSPIAMSGFRLTPEAIQARREAEISRALDWLSSHPDIR
ncbi:BZ3500_MvSof-1268-A1-R1_Chr3-1g05965 [Microbotryum saponariae]|uniref:BZ3500_MvSof-1268-A1-R1_Chr3-1g05965 protein n=1 Tax=Microbotryum saponariae TaxID=289078 RepID=A0A2X0LSS3_9BASI|nr:BZ3500_MvSof-1268-A1-R1_Chr3-1g05965 [Microbotryum saponariae]SDA05155.1 BZ3501_MvSof-1269-A2-R1_Chr3-1g05635 [Microbotryum saponariae]